MREQHSDQILSATKGNEAGAQLGSSVEESQQSKKIAQVHWLLPVRMTTGHATVHAVYDTAEDLFAEFTLSKHSWNRGEERKGGRGHRLRQRFEEFPCDFTV